jgi:hypothetical protein
VSRRAPVLPFILIGLSTSSAAIADTVDRDYLIANTPPDLLEALQRQNLSAEDLGGAGARPFYLRGDFDGDKRPDYAVSLPRAGFDELRLAVVWGKVTRDLTWLPDDALHRPQVWYVHDRRRKLPAAPAGTSAPRLRGDAIALSDLDARTLFVHWTGSALAVFEPASSP